MRKRILPILCLLIICVGRLCPFHAFAATPLDPAAEASLTLYYQKEHLGFPDLKISIYRVAEAFPDETFELIAPFDAWPVNIHGITMQEQWDHVASTLNSYIIADHVTPTREEMTDAEGTVIFSDLKTGLYFVSEAIADISEGTYIFNQFMVYLPTPQVNGLFDYDVEARPKCTEFIPKTKYTVIKLWKDAGNQSNRPEEVSVEIYKNGVLQETQILSASNNWSYTWHVSEDEPGKWTVAERAVPESYQVTIQQNGGAFTIINACKTKPDAPQTGDTFNPLPWSFAMCFSGMMLLILGVYGRRRKA